MFIKRTKTNPLKSWNRSAARSRSKVQAGKKTNSRVALDNREQHSPAIPPKIVMLRFLFTQKQFYKSHILGGA